MKRVKSVLATLRHIIGIVLLVLLIPVSWLHVRLNRLIDRGFIRVFGEIDRFVTWNWRR